MVKQGPIDEYEVLSGAIKERHFATGEITYKRFKQDKGSVTVPDVNYEVAHNLGEIPEILILTPTTSGVEGYVMEVTKSATSITVKANVSGVIVNWYVMA